MRGCFFLFIILQTLSSRSSIAEFLRTIPPSLPKDSPLAIRALGETPLFSNTKAWRTIQKKGFFGFLGVQGIEKTKKQSVYEAFTRNGVLQGVFIDTDAQGNQIVTPVQQAILTPKRRLGFPANLGTTLFASCIQQITGNRWNLLGSANTALMQDTQNKTYALFERDLPYEILLDFENHRVSSGNRTRIPGIQMFSGHSKKRHIHNEKKEVVIDTLEYNVFHRQVIHSVLRGDLNDRGITESTLKGGAIRINSGDDFRSRKSLGENGSSEGSGTVRVNDLAQRRNHLKKVLYKTIYSTRYLPIVHDFFILPSTDALCWIESPFQIRGFTDFPIGLNPDLPTFFHVGNETFIYEKGIAAFHIAYVSETPESYNIYAPIYESLHFSQDIKNVTATYCCIRLDRKTRKVRVFRNRELVPYNLDFPVLLENNGEDKCLRRSLAPPKVILRNVDYKTKRINGFIICERLHIVKKLFFTDPLPCKKNLYLSGLGEPVVLTDQGVPYLLFFVEENGEPEASDNVTYLMKWNLSNGQLDSFPLNVSFYMGFHSLWIDAPKE